MCIFKCLWWEHAVAPTLISTDTNCRIYKQIMVSWLLCSKNYLSNTLSLTKFGSSESWKAEGWKLWLFYISGHTWSLFRDQKGVFSPSKHIYIFSHFLSTYVFKDQLKLWVYSLCKYFLECLKVYLLSRMMSNDLLIKTHSKICQACLNPWIVPSANATCPNCSLFYNSF